MTIAFDLGHKATEQTKRCLVNTGVFGPACIILAWFSLTQDIESQTTESLHTTHCENLHPFKLKMQPILEIK